MKENVKRATSEADLRKLETQLWDILASAKVLVTKKYDEIVDAENDLWQKTAGILKCEGRLSPLALY